MTETEIRLTIKDEMKNKISMALKDPVLQQGFEIICKENAELKAFRQDCIKLSEDNVVMARQRAETSKQLTKAKEIIREFMKYEITEYDGSLEIHFEELKKQAEQFLSEVEK